MSKARRIVRIAQEVVDEIDGFFEVAGPGTGNRRTNEFMQELRLRARTLFGHDYSEQKICGDTQLAVDFFISAVATITEVALSLRNSNTEFDRDVLKTIMAQEADHSIAHLIFLSKPGAIKRLTQPSSHAIID